MVDEVIVVDDGSVDATRHVAERAGADVLSHGRNRGKGAALRTGIRAGVEAGADVLVLLDADGQHDPDLIPALVEPIETGESDFVIGSRRESGVGTPSRLRKIGRSILDVITNSVGNTDISDTQSGFRAVSSELVTQIELEPSGFGIESTMLVEAERLDATITEIEVPEYYPSSASPS